MDVHPETNPSQMISPYLCHSQFDIPFDYTSQVIFEDIMSIIQREYPEISSSSESEGESVTSDLSGDLSGDLFRPAKAVAIDEDICETKPSPSKLDSISDIPTDVTGRHIVDMMSCWSPFYGGDILSVRPERAQSLGIVGSSDPFIGECFYNTAEPESFEIISCDSQCTTEIDFQTPLSSGLQDDSVNVLFHSIEYKEPSSCPEKARLVPRKRQEVELSRSILHAVHHDHDYCVSNLSAAENVNEKHKRSYSTCDQSSQQSWSQPAKRRRISRTEDEHKAPRQVADSQREMLRQREQQRRQQNRENYEEIRRVIPPHYLRNNPSERQILEASIKYIAVLKADNEKMNRKKARLQKVNAKAKEWLARLRAESTDDVSAQRAEVHPSD